MDGYEALSNKGSIHEILNFTSLSSILLAVCDYCATHRRNP